MSIKTLSLNFIGFGSILISLITLASFLPVFYRKDSTFFMTVVASGAPLIIVPLAIVALVQITYGSKILGTLSLILSALIALFVLIPNNKANITYNDKLNSNTVSVMTFNTLWNNELPLIEKLEQANEFKPDILVLQEVLAKDVPQYQNLLKDYPYVEVGKYDDYNIVIFSKIEPIETKHVFSADRIFPVMSFKKHDAIIDFVGIHTTSPVNQERYAYWWTQFQDLIYYYNSLNNEDSSVKREAVMIGDFNATPQHGTMRNLLAQGLKYVNSHKTWGLPGFPYLMAIDNILVSPGVEVTMFKLGDANGSDHRALLAEVSF